MEIKATILHETETYATVLLVAQDEKGWIISLVKDGRGIASICKAHSGELPQKGDKL